jgi:hypothetical protein
MNQPDFTALFLASLGGSAKAIVYELRDGPQTIHDAVFLSSLIHDARLRRTGIEESGHLTIPMNRDCWELGFTEAADRAELHVVDCELRISGTVRAYWHSGPPEEGDPWVDYLWIGEAYRDDRAEDFELALVGRGWRFVVVLAKSEWSVALHDLEVPYLWSERHAL